MSAVTTMCMSRAGQNQRLHSKDVSIKTISSSINPTLHGGRGYIYLMPQVQKKFCLKAIKILGLIKEHHYVKYLYCPGLLFAGDHVT